MFTMNRELIEKFIEVTGEGEATAQQYLSMTDGNVEAAISLMFETGPRTESQNVESEETVRPPILPTQEILVPSEPMSSFSRNSNAVFDRFRDFAVETRRQEEELSRRATGLKRINQCKSKRLEDLFRPPCNILFLGSFIEAREHAKSLNRWLLVNVQNSQEFACQILNRDVWPNKQIQEIIKDHFVLWQVLSNTSDGKRYIDFYKVAQYPYLAIVDPRTGECMQTHNHITVDSLISTLNDMLSTHASPDSAPQDSETSINWNNFSSCNSKRRASSENSESLDKESKILPNKSSNSESKTIVTQRNTSLVTPGSSNILSKRRRLEELDMIEQKEARAKEREEASESKIKTPKTDTCDEPSLRLCLRLPNGGKEAISLCATDTIKNFLQKMESMGYPPSEHTYLVPYPKTNVGALSPEIRLLDTILFPSNTVFITKI